MNSVIASTTIQVIEPAPLRTGLLSSSCSTTTLGLLVSVYFLILMNQSFFGQVASAYDGVDLRHIIFLTSAALFALCMINAVVTLPAIRYLFKTWLILLLLTGSAASYFIDSYNVILDRNMIQNLWQTDWHEALELLSWKLAGYMFLLGVMPSILVGRANIRYGSVWRELLHKAGIILVSVAVIGAIALAFYQDYASLFRNNRHLRDLLVPTGYVYSLYSYYQKEHKAAAHALVSVGQDARLGPQWSTASPRKTVTILVLGETARAENFSLNGYTRETNPLLKQEDIVYFNKVHSCGTSTAASVPCMFSQQSRRKFDDGAAQYTENLLDVLKHAGLNVLWRDNNSGCKGVCERVEFEDLSQNTDPALCSDKECFDMVLLHNLRQQIEAQQKDLVIVLHQKGSHGPAYFLRSPREFQQFTPVCHTNQLQQCSQVEIVNAYDNTLLYTDYVLAQLIDFLKQNQDRYDSSMLYVSDHGESLSEGNLYLHGIPYAIAPEQQTHVPMLMWLSDNFARRMNIDKECLQQQADKPFSHDNLFSTVLGMLRIQTQVFRPEDNILEPCQS